MSDHNSQSTEVQPLLNAGQFAALLGISKSAFYRWIQEGHLPAGTKYGPNTTRWPRHVVEQWLAEKESASSSEMQQ